MVAPLSGSEARIGLAWAVEVGAFPTVLAGSLIAASAALPIAPASVYGIVAIAYGAIWLHERLLPERAEWRPSGAELANDIGFLAIVQVGLASALSAGMVAAAGALQAHQWPVRLLWPHHWSVWSQLLLMAVAADLPRYWLHRLSHAHGWLWRVHALHHAPTILYSTNVGRFHPIDKAMQFIVEVLPFMLLGVAPEVLSLYFVYYAVAGFYQHANCRVRLGLLNWIFAGPELHRWHHSCVIAESCSNYGNKLIVWDALFGTRFLPSGRRVACVGVGDPNYPSTLGAQLAAPFAAARRP